jgi:uncharacterized membrane protein YuzA (DUF378 family)
MYVRKTYATAIGCKIAAITDDSARSAAFAKLHYADRTKGAGIQTRGLSMWAIDHVSMILIILGGIGLGLKGAFGVNLSEYLGTYTNTVYIAIGVAALWQLRRQRFPVG